MNSEELKAVKLRQRSLERTYNRAWNLASTLHGLIQSVPSSNGIFDNYAVMGDVRNTQQKMSELHSSWNEVLKRALSNSEEISLLDNRGRTALHCACTKKPPLSVIRILLTSDGTDEECIMAMLMQRDNHGRTPLALSIGNNADPGVIKYLLHRCTKAAQIADNYQNLPLHIASMGDFDQDRVAIVQDLIDAFQDAVGILSKAGKTPLHLAVECGGSLEVIDALVQGTLRFRNYL